MPREFRESRAGEDGLDRRIGQARVPAPPADLLDRCLSTLPADGSPPHVARWLNGTVAAGPAAPTGTLELLTPESGMTRSSSFWTQWAPTACAAAALLAVGSVWYLNPAPGRTETARRESPAARKAADLAPLAKRNPLPKATWTPEPAASAVASPAEVAHTNALPAAEAAPRGAEAWVKAHLAAGEFGAAVAAAKQVKSLEVRDTYLAQIAEAQFRAGEYEGSLSTTGEIGDDRTRTEALARIGALPTGAAGGGINVDYDTLIQLIINSAGDRASWDDQGGSGTVRQFPQGVYVDVRGVLKRATAPADAQRNLAELRQAAASAARTEGAEVRKHSSLRKISLNRLEKAAQLRAARGLSPTEDMHVLAGLERIQYVFLYPETNDIVLAGPAGDWATDAEGRIVSVESGMPVVRLDDFLTISRYVSKNAGQPFGCLIDPRQENLAKVQEFIRKSSQRPLKAGERDAWVAELRDVVGLQDIRMIGPFDPTTRAARVMVEADHHMKLIGIGLADGTVNVPSYLDLLQLKPNEAAPPMGVLRWWFTLNYQALQANEKLTSFRLRGPAVQVKSEDMLLQADGVKVGTGKANELNQAFAHNFTVNYDALAAKYPVYADLRNVFDLAMVTGLMHVGGMSDSVNWHRTFFGDEQALPVEHVAAPTAVQSVVNHKVYHGKTIVAQVSGGVSVNPWPLLKQDQLEIDRKGTLDSRRDANLPVKLANDAWWWD